MATYSSRGPTVIDGVVKPELVGARQSHPGVGAEGWLIWRTSCRSASSVDGTDTYMELSGTSMSAAVAAGAAALVLEARPG